MSKCNDLYRYRKSIKSLSEMLSEYEYRHCVAFDAGMKTAAKNYKRKANNIVKIISFVKDTYQNLKKVENNLLTEYFCKTTNQQESEHGN